jgi:ribosome-binding protein aMBF1 (putative translation factor)
MYGLRTLLRDRGMTDSEYDKAFIARMRQLREALGWSGERMAAALNISGACYRTYERRTLLPHCLIKRFAQVTGVSIAHVVTGEHPGRPQKASPQKKLTRKERDELMRIVTKLFLE